MDRTWQRIETAVEQVAKIKMTTAQREYVIRTLQERWAGYKRKHPLTRKRSTAADYHKLARAGWKDYTKEVGVGKAGGLTMISGGGDDGRA